MEKMPPTSNPAEQTRFLNTPNRRFWLLGAGAGCLLLLIALAVRLQRTEYQYMQLFYYGPTTPAVGSPIMLFSPAFEGKTQVYLSKPDEYTRRYDPASTLFSGGTSSQTGVTTVSTEKGTYIDGKLQTPAQMEQLQQQELNSLITMTAAHVENVAAELSSALNGAADDGWEVVQMAPLEKDGLVYLFRKAK